LQERLNREGGTLLAWTVSRFRINLPQRMSCRSSGGIIGIVVGLVLIVIGAWVYPYNFSAVTGVVFGAIGVWGLISGAIVVVGAMKLNSNPWEHTMWGIIILVFSVIGMGTWLGLIGGILALICTPQSPVSERPPVSPVQVITRICPKCGRVLSEEMKFCPYCGNALG
jgi:hypothetical protein